jgi:thymidylate kinase
MIPATLIVVEGPDRVGKATQSSMLTRALSDAGHRVRRVEVPVKSPITYRLIYWMLRNGLAKSVPNLFQFVQFLNKFCFQIFHLVLMRWMYDFIIFDRWALSSVIYGDAGGANKRFTRFLFNRLWQPDGTVILVGAARSGETTDVYEADNSLQSNVRIGYSEWHSTHPEQTAIVDNLGTRDEVHQQIMNTLEERFDLL